MATLLSLPPEILQHILFYVTTPSFFQLVLACRLFYDLTASTRKVLLHHLQHITGHKLGLEDLSTDQLFLTLRRRAAQDLYGINFTVDCLHYPCPTSLLNASQGELSSASSKWDIDASASELCTQTNPNLAIVRVGEPKVRLYQATSSGISYRTCLNVSYDLFNASPDEAINIIKVRLSSNRHGKTVVSVLCTVFPCYEKPQSEMNRYEIEAFEDVGDGLTYLVRFTLDVESTVDNTAVSILEQRLGETPFTMAVDGEGTGFAVAWEHFRPKDIGLGEDSHMGRQVVVGWYRPCHTPPPSPGERVVILETHEPLYAYQNKDPDNWTTGHMTVRDIAIMTQEHREHRVRKAVLLYTASSVVHMSYVSLEHKPRPRVIVVSSNFQTTNFSYELSSVYMAPPFFEKHYTDDAAPNENKCLAIATPIVESEQSSEQQPLQWGVIVGFSELRRVPLPRERLSHVLHEPIDVQVLARLWGLGHTSLNKAAIWAISSRGTRIALARWDRIMIWPVHPQELLDRITTSYSLSFTDDHYFETVNCHHPGIPEEIVIIRPLQFRLDGGAVARQISFAGEDENTLFVMTDRGVLIYYLGPRAKARRETKSWPEKRPENHDEDHFFELYDMPDEE